MENNVKLLKEFVESLENNLLNGDQQATLLTVENRKYGSLGLLSTNSGNCPNGNCKDSSNGGNCQNQNCYKSSNYGTSCSNNSNCDSGTSCNTGGGSGTSGNSGFSAFPGF